MEELLEIAVFLMISSVAILLASTSLVNSTSWSLCEATRLALQHNGSAFLVVAFGKISCTSDGCVIGCLFVPASRIYRVGGRPAVGGMPGVVIVGTTPDGKLYITPLR